ncbi:MAG TPA: pseudouridine synthase [Syntrophomonadaceae bacterium]|nr:pseudouridine synthase [Syntrophomonadaceae bacterium]
MNLLRLAKYLANSGITSRRKAEELISEGRIKVNGRVVTEQGSKIDSAHDIVEFDDREVAKEDKVYFLLNKPRGYISSVTDPQGRPTVIDLLKDVKERLYPVGRLDYDTEGLLILTNDGYFSNLMTHPSYEVEKTYEALVKGVTTPTELDKLRQGILLEDGITAPAVVEIVRQDKDKTLLSIKIHEGRKRQIKRMCMAINHPVIHLRRTGFALLKNQDIKLGQYRSLTPNEVKELIEVAKNKKR